ncbi:MAG: hypothetical protein HRF49_01045 [bacterium]|jgi:hypothetical protein
MRNFLKYKPVFLFLLLALAWCLIPADAYADDEAETQIDVVITSFFDIWLTEVGPNLDVPTTVPLTLVEFPDADYDDLVAGHLHPYPERDNDNDRDHVGHIHVTANHAFLVGVEMTGGAWADYDGNGDGNSDMYLYVWQDAQPKVLLRQVGDDGGLGWNGSPAYDSYTKLRMRFEGLSTSTPAGYYSGTLTFTVWSEDGDDPYGG